MKIRCVKNNLEKIIIQAENFIGKNLDLEVLSCILLEASDGYLKIYSTNIDTYFFSEIPVVTEKEGRVALNGEVFSKTISAIRDEELSLELEDNILKIKSENSKVDLKIIPDEDFPNIIKMEDQEDEDKIAEIKMSAKDFSSGLTSTFYAASKSNIKPELSSVFVSGVDSDIYFAATDGFRLSEKTELCLGGDEVEEFSFLLPGGSIGPILKTLNTEEEKNLEIFIYSNQIFIKNSKTVIFSRLVDGNYVDYKKLIPEDTETSVIVLKQDFLESLKLINIFSDDFNQIKMIVKDKKLLIETDNNFGKNEIKIDAAIVGQDLEMNFNYKYIQDCFLSIKTDSFEFVFNTSKPVLIRPIGDKTFKYIVMPLSR